MTRGNPENLRIRMGHNLLVILNDLKRNSYTAARELEISHEELQSYISGEKEILHSIIEKASRVWPVNIRDFYVFEDDAKEGILVMTKEESERSSRVLKRERNEI